MLVRGLVLSAALVAACAHEEPDAHDETRERLPEFSLESVAGERVSLRYHDGSLQLALPGQGKPVATKALLVHFLQPDCNACIDEMKALDELHREVVGREVAILGIDHRGKPEATRDVARDLELSYPVLLGHGSEVAKAHARGDATVIADSKGVIRYTQVGFQPEDVSIWRTNLDRLLAGEDVATHESGRERIAKGDVFPGIRLPGLRDGRARTLAVEGGRLTLVDETGTEFHPKAAVGFFSRY